jgi:hypothetical protein
MWGRQSLCGGGEVEGIASADSRIAVGRAGRGWFIPVRPGRPPPKQRRLCRGAGPRGANGNHLAIRPALTLLRAFIAVAEERFAARARGSLDAASVHRQPERGDFWETSLHTLSLLVTIHGTVAHTPARPLFGRESGRVQARHWLWSPVVFPHLWQSKSRPMLHDTEPISRWWTRRSIGPDTSAESQRPVCAGWSTTARIPGAHTTSRNQSRSIAGGGSMDACRTATNRPPDLTAEWLYHRDTSRRRRSP